MQLAGECSWRMPAGRLLAPEAWMSNTRAARLNLIYDPSIAPADPEASHWQPCRFPDQSLISAKPAAGRYGDSVATSRRHQAWIRIVELKYAPDLEIHRARARVWRNMMRSGNHYLLPVGARSQYIL